MRRIPCRHVLPLLALLLTAALIFVGREQERPWHGADGPPPFPIEIAGAINVPAGVAALPGALLYLFVADRIDHSTPAGWREVLGEIYFGFFVFGQWFFIGRWVDRHRGLMPARSAKWRPSRSLIIYALVGSVVFAIFGILRMIYSGWMSTWIPGASILGWSLIAIVFLIFRLRRSFVAAGPESSQQIR